MVKVKRSILFYVLFKKFYWYCMDAKSLVIHKQFFFAKDRQTNQYLDMMNVYKVTL